MSALKYEREPEEIYRQSFDAIGRLEAVAGIDSHVRDVAIRLVHACGMPEILPDLRYSKNAVETGRAALSQGVGVYCDVESLRYTIMPQLLPKGVALHCRLSSPDTESYAKQNRMTRAAAQIDLWGERLKGAIVVIGNAPTALFRLLEMIDAGSAPPALVIAFPVGFVGAAESKQALVEDPREMEFVTLLGKKGGTAMAAAAMNAISGGLGR